MTEYNKAFYEEYVKPWREKNSERWSEYNKRLMRKHRKTLIDLLGGVCIICRRGSDKTPLIVHERYGRPHNRSFKYLIKHLEDYVLLCRSHHASVHRWKNECVLEAVIKVLQDLNTIH